MHVAHKDTNDPDVTEVGSFSWRSAQFLDRQLWRLQKTASPTWRSPARFGALSARWINEQDSDVVHLHWVTDGFLSVEEIGRIRKPVVWSIYDMWPIMGTEHYGPQDQRARWRIGFTTGNRAPSESGIDIDRWTFDRKQRYWESIGQSLTAAPASAWMEKNIRESLLGHEWNQLRVPHVVDTNIFTPLPKAEAHRRLRLGIDDSLPTLLFLSSAGLSDPRKGWDLLQTALQRRSLNTPDLNVLIVGPLPPITERTTRGMMNFARLHWIGPVSSDDHLRLLYCASDAVAIPSRNDNLPLVALEAQSCGRPVLAFATGGLPDVIDPQFSGYLAEPASSHDLAEGLNHVFAQRDAYRIREHALNLWSPQVVVPQFLSLYDHLR
jgi:glycosyltransferase involved in cell wall biosynthesis